MANGYLFELPEWEGGDDSSNEALAARMKRLEKYLYSLNEQLRYSMYNIDEDNFSPQYQQSLSASIGEMTTELKVELGLIQSTVAEMEGGMTQITQTVDELSFDVYDENGRVAAEIEMGLDGIKMSADQVKIRGNVYLSDLFEGSTTMISGDHIDTGSIRLTKLYVEGSSKDSYIGTDDDVTYIYSPDPKGEIMIGNPSGSVQIYGDLTAGEIEAISGYFESWCYSPDWTEGSDRRLKHDIETLDAAKMEELVTGLRPVRYRLNDDEEDKLRYGFVAQEVKATLEAVGEDEGDSPVYRLHRGLYGLNYTDLIAPMVSVLQSMLVRMGELEARVAALEAAQEGAK